MYGNSEQNAFISFEKSLQILRKRLPKAPLLQLFFCVNEKKCMVLQPNVHMERLTDKETSKRKAK